MYPFDVDAKAQSSHIQRMDCLQDAPVKAPWLFTSETARKNVQIAIANRRAKAEALRNAKLNPPQQPANDASDSDPLATDLVRVQEQLVQKMLAANGNPDSIPKLARSFRDVREAYHLVTGQAKPGVIREPGRSSRQRSQAKPQPLPDDGPTEQT